MDQPTKTYHIAYQIMQDYEFLLQPLSAGAIGAANLGFNGALAGATLGTIDLLSNYYKLYDKPYLTSAVLGWGASYKFKAPYQLNEIAGFTTGILLPTGVFDQHFDKIATPLIGVTYGTAALGGQEGIIIGFVAGALDAYSSHFNISNENHLTSFLFNLAMIQIYIPKLAKILPNYFHFINTPTIKLGIAGISSAIKLYQNEQPKKEKSAALLLNNKLHDSYSKVIPKEELDNLNQKKYITIATAALLSMRALSLLANYQQSISQDFHNLDKLDMFENFSNDFKKSASLLPHDIDRKKYIVATHFFIKNAKLLLDNYQQSIAKNFPALDELNMFDNFFSNFKSFALFLPVLAINNAVNSFIQSYFSTKIFTLVQDNTYGRFMDGETALYLSKNISSNSTDSNILLKNIDDDIDNVIDLGNTLITDRFSSIIKGTYAAACIYSAGAADMIIYSQSYNQLTAFITKFLSTKVEQDSATIKDLEARLASTDEYTRNHASEMIQSDANNFVSEIRTEISNDLRKLYSTKSVYESLYNPWQYLHSYIDFAFNYLAIASKISNKELSFDKRFEVLFVTYDLSNMVGWEASNQAQITKLDQSIIRFNEFSDRMDEIKLPLEHLVNYTYQKSEQTKICFENLNIGIKNESILHLNECITGKHIAITGASGGGKTSFFKAL
jgi:hypothetical protein